MAVTVSDSNVSRLSLPRDVCNHRSPQSIRNRSVSLREPDTRLTRFHCTVDCFLS